MLVHNNALYIGQADGKVRALNLKDLSDICEPIRVGLGGNI